VLFGTDTLPSTPGGYPSDSGLADGYRRHFRFLETADEHFPHDSEEPSSGGRWRISGADLPDEALRAVYGGNAARLVPQLAAAVQ
jgi:hypothetical protein